MVEWYVYVLIPVLLGISFLMGLGAWFARELHYEEKCKSCGHKDKWHTAIFQDNNIKIACDRCECKEFRDE